MKAEELRIGNYYQWSKFASMGVPGPQQITHGQQIMDYIALKEGIPLTEEWLIKFGFKLLSNGVVFDHPAPRVPEDEHKDLGTHYPSFFFNTRPEVKKWMDCWTRVTVEYVHQLQNLYYALTGEELTISEPTKQSEV